MLRDVGFRVLAFPGAVFSEEACSAYYIGKPRVNQPVVYMESVLSCSLHADCKKRRSSLDKEDIARVHHNKSGTVDGASLRPGCGTRLANSKSGEGSVSKKDIAGVRHSKGSVASTSPRAGAGVAAVNSKSGKASVKKKNAANMCHDKSLGNASVRVSAKSQASYKNGKSSVSKKDVAGVRHDKSGVGNSSPGIFVAKPLGCENSKIPVSKRYAASVHHSSGAGSSPSVSAVKPLSCEGSKIPVSKRYAASVHRNSGAGSSSSISSVKQMSCGNSKQKSANVQGSGGGSNSPQKLDQSQCSVGYSGYVDKLGARAVATVFTSVVVCEFGTEWRVARAAFIACRS